MPFNFDPRVCEECWATYKPRSRTQRFCSECEYVTVLCEVCGAEARRTRAFHLRRPLRFCSRRCKGAACGGLYFNPSMGRWIVVCRGGSTMLFSRAVMAGHLGRLLERNEFVHHINRDPSDDRIENLAVLTPGEHVRLHRADMRAGWRRRKERLEAAR